MQFETVQLFFLGGRGGGWFRFIVIQKFCYHGNVTYRLLLPMQKTQRGPYEGERAGDEYPASKVASTFP